MGVPTHQPRCQYRSRSDQIRTLCMYENGMEETISCGLEGEALEQGRNSLVLVRPLAVCLSRPLHWQHDGCAPEQQQTLVSSAPDPVVSPLFLLLSVYNLFV